MPLAIFEWYGFSPKNKSQVAASIREKLWCPFIDALCTKRFNNTDPNGSCTLKPPTSRAVICCPNRLYGDGYKVLREVAETCFGQGVRLIKSFSACTFDGKDVIVFGHRWGHELRLPRHKGSGGYYVDWILAHINPKGDLQEFVAIEVQTMDTTGSYVPQVQALFRGDDTFRPKKSSNINWENVNKRILPQIIYKGHVLRREALCTKGLFFICPEPVYDNILRRLGGKLEPYPPHQGTITFRSYGLVETTDTTKPFHLNMVSQLTTSVEQVEHAFSSAINLPESGVYEKAIRAQLKT
jgi:hypothetical protein